MGICALILLVILLFPTSTVIGESMQPTILSGDALIGERISKLTHSLFRRGDIVSFRVIEEMIKFIPPALLVSISEFSIFPQLTFKLHGIHLNKRIVGLPGERLEIREGQLYINDDPIKESWASGLNYELKKLKDIGYLDYRPFLNSEEPIVVPAKHYFVLGDHHTPANVDSHMFGFVNYKAIRTRQKWIFWRMGKFHFVRLGNNQS